jgi:hypothetical protein
MESGHEDNNAMHRGEEQQDLQEQQQQQHLHMLQQEQLQRDNFMQREQQLQHEQQMHQQMVQQQHLQLQMQHQQQQMHHQHQLQQHHEQQHHQQQQQHMNQQQEHDDLAAEDIITAVNSIGEASAGLDNGLGEHEHTQQEQAALVEALAVAGPAPPLLLQAEKCLSIQEIVNLCREFEMCDKISRREFAKARDVSRTKFDRYWKNYRVGKYNNVKLANKRQRVKPGKYLAVENKLVEFLEDRKAQGIKNDLSWLVLSEKALELSKDILSEPLQATFKASAGWLYGVLHRNGFIHVDLTGNDNNIAVAIGAPVVAPSLKAPPKLTPQPAIVVNGDVTMV